MHAPVQNNEKTSVLQVTVFSPLEAMVNSLGCWSEHRH